MRQVRGATLALPATDLEVQIKALLLKLNQGPLMAIKTLETCKPADFRHVRDVSLDRPVVNLALTPLPVQRNRARSIRGRD